MAQYPVTHTPVVDPKWPWRCELCTSPVDWHKTRRQAFVESLIRWVVAFIIAIPLSCVILYLAFIIWADL